jgi:hypothetical protein
MTDDTMFRIVGFGGPAIVLLLSATAVLWSRWMDRRYKLHEAVEGLARVRQPYKIFATPPPSNKNETFPPTEQQLREWQETVLNGTGNISVPEWIATGLRMSNNPLGENSETILRRLQEAAILHDVKLRLDELDGLLGGRQQRQSQNAGQEP